MPKKTKDLLLVMDVGNTNTVLGVYEGAQRFVTGVFGPKRKPPWMNWASSSATFFPPGLWI